MDAARDHIRTPIDEYSLSESLKLNLWCVQICVSFVGAHFCCMLRGRARVIDQGSKKAFSPDPAAEEANTCTKKQDNARRRTRGCAPAAPSPLRVIFTNFHLSQSRSRKSASLSRECLVASMVSASDAQRHLSRPWGRGVPQLLHHRPVRPPLTRHMTRTGDTRDASCMGYGSSPDCSGRIRLVERRCKHAALLDLPFVGEA